MYRYIIAVILSIFPLFAFAESGSIAPKEFLSCDKTYELMGPSGVKMATTNDYQVIRSGTIDFSGSVTYILKRDNQVIETIKDREKYTRYFSTPGEVLLEAHIQDDAFLCETTIQKKIRVYQSVMFYIGSEIVGLNAGIENILENNNILMKSSINDKTMPSQSEKSPEIWDSINQSDILVVGNQDILGFFSDIVRLQKIKQINFTKKKIFIISHFSKPFLSKVLASSLSQIGATKVFLISEDQLYSIAARLSTGKGEDMYIGQELSYEKGKTIYSLSSFVEFLAYAGFSYQLLAFLLSITFAVLVLNFLKQIIGFNVFGIYYPVLLAITIVSLGISGSFMFMTIGFVSILLVNIFSKKIHLLLHAKRALLISLYIMLFLFVLGIDNFFELSFVTYSLFDNSLIIFPFFITIILADKIFQDDIHIFNKLGISDILQYGAITFILYSLFEYKALQYFLISYPDIIILVVILNVFVGRYVGLQAFEYFRFAPLLRKLDEEE